METFLAKMGENGRLVVPAKVRHELGLEQGDTVVLRVKNNEVRLTSLKESVRHAQEIIRRCIPGDDSLVDELLADRRREVEGG